MARPPLLDHRGHHSGEPLVLHRGEERRSGALTFEMLAQKQHETLLHQAFRENPRADPRLP